MQCAVTPLTLPPCTNDATIVMTLHRTDDLRMNEAKQVENDSIQEFQEIIQQTAPGFSQAYQQFIEQWTAYRNAVNDRMNKSNPRDHARFRASEWKGASGA